MPHQDMHAVSNLNLSKQSSSRVNLILQHRLLSAATPLTCNNSTLAAKTVFFSIHYYILCFKSVTKYFAQGILVTQLIVIYDF